MSLNPQITDQGTKVKMTWTPDPACQGYRFYIDGVAVSRTFTPTQASTTFAKPDANPHRYGIQKMDVVPPFEEFTFPVTPPPPGQWTHIANEHESFTLTQASTVRYGKNATWVQKALAAGTYVCNSTQFGGDPLPTVPKECQVAGGTPPPPPPPPPPPGGTRIPADGIIRTGGVWYGDPFVGQVSIRTTQPVTLTGDIRFPTAGGYIIDAFHDIPGAGIDVTLSHVKFLGGDTYDKSARSFVARDYKRIVIANCTFEYTRGIELWPCLAVSSPTVQITRNRHHNVLGGATLHGLGYVGNFVQFREVTNAQIEVSWNEILNEYNRSEPEDIISIYHTNNAHVFDNYLQHHSQPGNQQPGSFGGITIDGSDSQAIGTSNNLIERNQIVDGMGIVAAVQHAGSNNQILNNRIIADQFIPGGALKRAGYSGLAITPGPGSGNHAHGNLVGYMGVDPNNWPGNGGFRSDGDLSGADEGDASEWTRNTHLGHNPTSADEAAELTFWNNKVAAAGVTIGA